MAISAPKATTHLSYLQKKAVFLASLGEFIDGYDLLVMGAALLYLTPRFHLSAGQIGALGAAAYIGAAVGLLIFGNMADKLGRRTIFMFNLVFFVVFALLSAFITSTWELFITRFFVGLGVGADIPTSMSYIAEVSPPAQRGRLLGALPQITWIVGAAVATFLGIVMNKFFGPTAWRWMFGVAAIPALLVLLGRRSLPESPRWLQFKGRDDEAHAVLQQFGLSDPVVEVGDRANFWEIFSRPYRTRTLVVATINGLDCLSVAIATLSVPFILRYVGLMSVENSLIFSGLAWGADLVGAVLNYWLIDRFPRRAVAMATMIPMGLSGIGIALFGVHDPTVLIMFVFLFGFFHWLGSAQCVWAWGSELFPTRIRGSAQGFGNAICRLAIGANIFIIPLGLTTIGFPTTVFLLSLPPLINGAIAYGYRPLETKGYELENLQAQR